MTPDCFVMPLEWETVAEIYVLVGAGGASIMWAGILVIVAIIMDRAGK